jgi:hypothetical protein
MIFLPSLCEIGILVMNQAPMGVVNGRRTGKTSSACAENSTYHVAWCVNAVVSFLSLLTPQRVSRPICQETIGTEYSSLRSGHGRMAVRRIPMSGVTGTQTHRFHTNLVLLTRFSQAR